MVKVVYEVVEHDGGWAYKFKARFGIAALVALMVFLAITPNGEFQPDGKRIYD